VSYWRTTLVRADELPRAPPGAEARRAAPLRQSGGSTRATKEQHGIRCACRHGGTGVRMLNVLRGASAGRHLPLRAPWVPARRA
jgi:hypothetical protein